MKKLSTSVIIAIVVLVVVFIGAVLVLALTNNMNMTNGLVSACSSFVSILIVLFGITQVPAKTVDKINGSMEKMIQDGVKAAFDARFPTLKLRQVLVVEGDIPSTDTTTSPIDTQVESAPTVLVEADFENNKIPSVIEPVDPRLVFPKK